MIMSLLVNRVAFHLLLICSVALVSGARAQSDSVGHPTFLSPHSNPIASDGTRVFVANTPADSVDVIDAESRRVVARVNVGIDPVSLALRPDGRELWVSNHVSDSVSVIDLDRDSATHLQVIATVQDLDSVSRATRFDEPVGIAFASNDKAYVALSSENRIAVVDVATRQVQSRLFIGAQDPRAIRVRGDRLYVIPFESNNQTQISGCAGPPSGGLCTFDANEHVVNNNNVLSLGVVVDIVRDPRVPDRDLYVFDTRNDQQLQVVNGLGTLLYGLAVDTSGKVFVAQTDARNLANGRAGTRGDGLAEMGNRAFLNQLTRVDCSSGSCAFPQRIDLEPLPPANPPAGAALATPFAIEISADDATLVVTAAGSNLLFTVDAASGEVLGRAAVEAIPRGIALESDGNGAPVTAWVYNAGSNSVSLVDLSNPASPQALQHIALVDPTHPQVKRGRIVFNDANVSTSGTYSCESCHPDGGTDQLLWVLDTPWCSLPGCTQIPPRVTMPIRGLRDTAPYHWDGIPGDPYGGNNTANILGSSQPNCDRDEPESCTLDLVDGGLATTMCAVGGCALNEDGKAGALSAAQRDDMAKFLLSVPYPPAQRRAFDDRLSAEAINGFRLFHIEGDLQGNPTPNVCGDCHRLPFWVSTNTPGTGMEAPTWRGAYDRWLILPQGRLNIIDFSFYRSIAQAGAPEESVWRLSWAGRQRFNPVWDMVLEGGTGFPGAFGRQLTLNAGNADDAATLALLQALEQAAEEQKILLSAEGARLTPPAEPVELHYALGGYVDAAAQPVYSPEALRAAAAAGELQLTLTARLGAKVDVDHPQPALWTRGPIQAQRGRQQFPQLGTEQRVLSLSGRHVQPGAMVYVDGERVAANVRCVDGELPDCAGEALLIQLAALPDSAGMHMLQVQNRHGLVSNEFIFHTLAAGTGRADYDVSGPWARTDQAGHGWMIEQVPPAAGSTAEQLVVYWYVYRDGRPVWLIAQGEFRNGIAELQAYVTAGGAFPPAFDPAAVDLIPWGRLSLEFADDRTATVRWESVVDGFADGAMNIVQIAPIADAVTACQSGSYYNLEQPGHGFVAEVVEVNGQLELVLAWYVYADGQQLWLFGQAPLVDGQAEVPMLAYQGADFPPAFVASEVSSSAWGTVTMRFTGPNSARADWEANTSASGSIDLVRLTGLVGHRCQ